MIKRMKIRGDTGNEDNGDKRIKKAGNKDEDLWRLAQYLSTVFKRSVYTCFTIIDDFSPMVGSHSAQ